MKKLYISDLDGTLLLPGAKVGKKTEETINTLISQGANITFCTARNLEQCKDILHCFNVNLPIALVNGALVYDPIKRSYIKKSIINNQLMKKILCVYKSFGHYPFMFRLIENNLHLDYVRENNEVGKIFIQLFGKNFKSLNKRDEYEFDNDVVYLSSFETKEYFSPIYNELRKIEGINVQFYFDVNSGLWLIEVLSSTSNKKTAAEFIKDYCSLDCVVAFGDNDNDIPMIEFADCGIAVENSTEKLKNTANLVIGTNLTESVAEFILNDFTKM